MARASGRRPWPQIAGRPTPSTVRCAHRSARGKPAPPERWTRRRLRLRLRSSLRFDLTRFPARGAPGAGAMPPGRLPVRGRTSGRLGPPAPAGSPRPIIDRRGAGAILGAAGSDALVPRHGPWPCRGPHLRHLTCGNMAARLRLAAGKAQTGRMPDCARGAAYAAPAGFGASEVPYAAFARSPFLRPCSRPATPQGPAAFRALHHPVPSGCGLGSALAYWPVCLGALFARATNSGSTAKSK